MKALASIVALVLLMLADAFAGQSQTRLYGEVDCDSEVTAADVPIRYVVESLLNRLPVPFKRVKTED